MRVVQFARHALDKKNIKEEATYWWLDLPLLMENESKDEKALGTSKNER